MKVRSPVPTACSREPSSVQLLHIPDFIFTAVCICFPCGSQPCAPASYVDLSPVRLPLACERLCESESFGIVLFTRE